MERIKSLILFLIIIGNIDAEEINLEYTWTEAHPILTNYVYENKKNLFDNASYILNRGEKYMPYIYEVAEKENVPKEIAIVAAIESAFNANALSHAGALGMWQFMEETGRDMGIVGYQKDERTDWKKSTEAAIKYIKWLSVYNFNGDYELALLAYNGGIGRVKRAIKHHNTNDPWELIEVSNLPQETKEYLPKFISYVYYYHYTIN